MDQISQEKDGRQMRYRALLVAVFLVLSVAICGLSAEEELTNDSRKTAVAVRITFTSRVMITRHGREFSNQEPASGLSDVFVFSGGEVRRNGTFEVKWAPGMAIKSVEWLEALSAEDQQKMEEDQQEMEEVADCSCILSPGDSLASRLLNTYGEGLVICMEPGEYVVSEQVLIVFEDATIRGIHSNSGEVKITGPEWLEPVLSVFSSAKLIIENISWESSQIMTIGSAVLDIQMSSIGKLVLSATSSANVMQSSLRQVIAKDGTTSTFIECVIEGEGSGTGITASGYAVISVIDSTIRNATVGISASDNAIVRLTRGEFVDCDTDTKESDSGVIEIH